MRASAGIDLGRESRNWLSTGLTLVFGAIITTLIFTSVAAAQQATKALPDLSGTYSCEGHKTTCEWSGNKFTITQSGADLAIRSEKGDFGHAKLTSNISLSAGPIWNMLGVIVSPDNQVIEWSNGTTWRKQSIS